MSFFQVVAGMQVLANAGSLPQLSRAIAIPMRFQCDCNGASLCSTVLHCALLWAELPRSRRGLFGLSDSWCLIDATHKA